MSCSGDGAPKTRLHFIAFGGGGTFFADFFPIWECGEQFGKLGHCRWNIDILGACGSACAACDAGGRKFFCGECVKAHRDDDIGCEACVIVGGEEHGDIELHWASITAVSACGTRDDLVHIFSDIEQELAFVV